MTQVDQTRSAKDATTLTAAANAAVRGALPFDDRQDFEDVRRGLIAAAPSGPITGAGGRPVWDADAYAFEAAEAVPGDGQPEPVAAGAAQREQRAVPGDRPHLPGARLRHLQHDDHRGQTRGLIVIDPLVSHRDRRAPRSSCTARTAATGR